MVERLPDAYQIYDQAKHVSACGPPPPASRPPIRRLHLLEERELPAESRHATCSRTARPTRTAGIPRAATMPPAWDPRWMTLFILDELAFTQSGKKTYPIRRFGMFYVTAVSGLNCPRRRSRPRRRAGRDRCGALRELRHARIRRDDPDDEAVLVHDGGLCVSNLVE